MAKQRSNGQALQDAMSAGWTVALARAMQLFGIPAIMALTIWMFNTVLDINKRVTTIEETIKQRIAWSDDRFGEVKREAAASRAETNTVQQRMNDMDGRVRALESEAARRGRP